MTLLLANTLFENSLLAIAILLIIAAMLMGIRKRKKRRASGNNGLTAHEHLERLKEKQAVRGDMETLMVELEALGKQLTSQLDAKTIMLEKLVDEAELRIAQLQQLQSSTPHTQPTQNDNTPPSSQSEKLQNRPKKQNLSATPTDLPTLYNTQEIKETDHETIYKLADDGQTSQQISAATGEHIGKIELILALRRA
ncbi:hypothetical protein [Poriferisphaera sp. WC338]|uniref:hypothetical protein n=1 Tax=Poriferisphaera sp. WC338 TaxID=3425129 RepID=UPI003D81599A